MTQELPADAEVAVQVAAIAEGPAVVVAQVVLIQALPAEAVTAEQDAIAVGPTALVAQLVVTQELPAEAVTAVQD